MKDTETNKRYYTSSVQLSAKHEPIIVLLDVNEKAQQGFKVLQKHLYNHNSAHIQIASVTGVDKLHLLVLVVVSAIFNEALVLKALKYFDD